MEEKRLKFLDILVMGMALFAMFFGAGNLIFPPLLGQQSGTSWLIGFLFFIVFDVGLSLLAILALVKKGKYSLSGITDVMGKIPCLIISCIAAICIGPMPTVARTAAVTFEMGVQPLFPNFNSWIFSGLFFIIVLILAIRPNQVADIVGKVLTPILVIGLLVMIVKGFIDPIGAIDVEAINNPIKDGTLSGYQTLDVISAMLLILVIIDAITAKGYTTQSEMSKAALGSGIVAAIGLFIIYGGLTYLGATTCNVQEMQGLNQTALLVAIVEALFGNVGIVLFAIIVFLACIITAIGATSAVAMFFEKTVHQKISYQKFVIIIVILSWIFSNVGVSVIIQFSTPLLNLIYPGLLVIVILTLFCDKIKNRNIYRVAVYFAMITSALEILAGFGLPTGFVTSLPLGEFGFAWILPAILGGIIGKCIPDRYAEDAA